MLRTCSDPGSRERETGANVIGSQVREVREYFRFGHARREVLEHVVHRDAQSANARLAAAFPRLDRYDGATIHPSNVSKAPQIATAFEATRGRRKSVAERVRRTARVTRAFRWFAAKKVRWRVGNPGVAEELRKLHGLHGG
jgi:hypothetical protein